MSLIFYAWGEGYLVLLMVISILVNYVAGLAIDECHKKSKTVAKILLGISVALNLVLLIYYKYFNFIVENLQAFGLEINLENEPIHLPIGISFFTFQSISYLVDVFRNETEVQKNPLNLGLYISLFPQLVAGPIVRYHDIARQIAERKINNKKFTSGTARFIRGLGKKVIIGNSLALIADETFAIPAAELPSMVAWLGIICYSLQIYFDFSGYSDMAIGLGKMLGFNFLENFNYPYISKSIQEFWRRWHISLSSWFRDYLYIPLGGNRGGTFFIYRNLFIVFFVTGLWHGASWNFVVWGLFHGAFLVLERVGLKDFLNRTPSFIQHAYLILVVIIGWVFFRSPDLSYAFSFLQSMIGLNSGGNFYPLLYFDNYRIATLILGVLLSTPFVKVLVNKLKLLPNPAFNIVKPMYKSFSLFSALAILILCAMELAQSSYNPFIYFRF